MVMNRRTGNKPVVFGRRKTDNDLNSPDEDTLDMLLHYAKAGMEYAEKSLLENPGSFSAAEKNQFEQNKNMLNQAPFLIKTYKSKANEHDALHAKMITILKKCEEIVSSGDERAKEDIKEVLQEAAVFSYDKDGNLTVMKDVP